MTNEDSICPAGYYCAAGTAKPKTSANMCQPGYFCPAESSTATACTAGKYCQGYALAAVSGDCLDGYWCAGQASVPNPTDGTTGNVCPKGHYCPSGIDAATACAIGTYNNKIGSHLLADCLQCIAGKVCETAGLDYPVDDCPAGSYCPLDASTETQVACPIGHKCPTGSHEPQKC